MEQAARAALAIDRGVHRPSVGLILGSGLGGIADRLEDARRTPFSAVEGMPAATVVGHAGAFVVGGLAGRSVAAMQGRVHMYEGHDAARVAYPVRILAALGCRTLILTNAAGGLDPGFQVGDLMAIVDHIFLPGLAGQNPLIGQPGERFVSMSAAYDPALVNLAGSAAAALGFELRRGVYAMVSGPSYETSAEVRFLRAIGASAVGMSTAPEAIVARQLGLRLAGISCITNVLDPDRPAPVDHAEVLAAGAAARARFAALVERLVGLLPSPDDVEPSANVAWPPEHSSQTS